MPNERGDRLLLVGLDVEEENVGLIVGVDRAELSQENVAREVDREEKKRSQA